MEKSLSLKLSLKFKMFKLSVIVLNVSMCSILRFTLNLRYRKLKFSNCLRTVSKTLTTHVAIT